MVSSLQKHKLLYDTYVPLGQPEVLKIMPQSRDDKRIFNKTGAKNLQSKLTNIRNDTRRGGRAKPTYCSGFV